MTNLADPGRTWIKAHPFIKDVSAGASEGPDFDALLWERAAIRELLDRTEHTRPDLAWYRDAALEGFLFLYDTAAYDPETGQYLIDAFLDDGEREYGGYDVIILWQPYPRIGIDERNQFDYWRDMPGGIDGLRDLVSRAHARGVRCLINYLPWDVGTWRGDVTDSDAIAEIVDATGADGIFGDTMLGFPPEFRDALDRIGSGHVLESECDPTLKSMQWQSGMWIQEPNPLPGSVPVFRWIEPKLTMFAINRHLNDRRELLTWSFFYGMGILVWENIFGWWNPFGASDRAFVRRIKPLLKAHRDAFGDRDWRPIPTSVQGVFANRWQAEGKTVVTLWNTTSEPARGVSISVPWEGPAAIHDVWNGRELDISRMFHQSGPVRFAVDIDPGQPGCVVIIPPGSAMPHYALPTTATETRFRSPSTADSHLPRPVAPVFGVCDDPTMVRLPAATVSMTPRHTWPFDQGGCYDHPGSYGNHHDRRLHEMSSFLIDRTEVTNADYREFLSAANYQPRDLTNFLRHWSKPDEFDSHPASWTPPPGLDDHPVVWVDLTDARAYAKWANKRLPTEYEWQYAAHGWDGRAWPWGTDFDPACCNSGTPGTTPVDAYPDGASPYGCLDMAGNVWEWTESERNDGHTRYALLKSGSWWQAEGSRWYVASGAQQCDAHQKMLLLYPGLDRCSTIGFRCVRDLSDATETN